jgi:hypothetical protein
MLDWLTPERPAVRVSSTTRLRQRGDATGQAAPEPARGQDVFRFMKTFIVKCPVTDVNIITPMPEAVVVPPEGTTVYLECPCCGLPHQMRLRDARYFKRAS